MRPTDRRMRPITSPGLADACVSAPSSWPSAGPALSISWRPASVGDTLRVVRVSSATPSCSSSCRTAWLTADGETPSSRAAALKP